MNTVLFSGGIQIFCQPVLLQKSYFFSRFCYKKSYFSARMAVRYGTLRICVLRTSHLEQYRTSVPYFNLEMATAQRTRPRAVVGAPRRAAWQLKSALRQSNSAAYKNFFTFFLQLLLVIFPL